MFFQKFVHILEHMLKWHDIWTFIVHSKHTRKKHKAVERSYIPCRLSSSSGHHWNAHCWKNGNLLPLRGLSKHIQDIHRDSTIIREKALQIAACLGTGNSTGCGLMPWYLKISVHNWTGKWAQKKLLFIDQHAACSKNTTFLRKVKCVFFPANCTSQLQPLNFGIICTFK
jgi:hypothetical protein